MLENFGIKDIVDIILVAFFMYQAYLIMKRSGTSTIFNGVLAFIVLWILVSHVFQMRLLGAILDTMMNIGFFVLIILFQDDIRRFLMSLGSYRAFRVLQRLFTIKRSQSQESQYTPIVLACMNMAKSKTGALIVIEQDVRLNRYEQTGELINAEINTLLIENIFFKNSPLHDGAMIISSGRVKCAGCILPISQNQDIPKHFGLRHRAGLGISQETDAKVIIISEERGKISFAHSGNIRANISPEELQELLIEKYAKK
ncbi:MAG: TIGR00159 family protein [Bacteroidales bacterium 45-6]|nr:MAG: TIGR00159 family protein [Bacteroidales bacterium 45-6]